MDNRRWSYDPHAPPRDDDEWVVAGETDGGSPPVAPAEPEVPPPYQGPAAYPRGGTAARYPMPRRPPATYDPAVHNPTAHDPAFHNPAPRSATPYPAPRSASPYQPPPQGGTPYPAPRSAMPHSAGPHGAASYDPAPRSATPYGQPRHAPGQYAPDQGYGPDQGYAPDQGYGAGRGYAPDQGYGVGQGYAPEQGYGAGQAYGGEVPDPATYPTSGYAPGGYPAPAAGYAPAPRPRAEDLYLPPREQPRRAAYREDPVPARSAPEWREPDLPDPGRDEPELAVEPDRPAGWPIVAAWTVSYFLFPMLLYVVWAITRNADPSPGCVEAGLACASPREEAITGLLGAMPAVGGALALALLVSALLRRLTAAWRPGTVGFAAGIIGAGIATLVSSILA